jgi:hypothetical protein
MKTDELPLREAEAWPALIEYELGGEWWRCARGTLLAAELLDGVAPQPEPRSALARLHILEENRPRAWLVVRRLFGIMPVIPRSTDDPDNMRVWSRTELQDALGISKSQLQQELDAVRGALMGAAPGLPARPAPAPPTPGSPAVPAGKGNGDPQGSLGFDAEEEFLAAAGFPNLHMTVGERAWFVPRLRDFQKILDERLTAALGRNVLMQELQMRRLDEYINGPECRTGTKDYKEMMKLRQELDTNYQRQIEQLESLCPWAGQVAGKYAFKGQLTDITTAIRNYKAREDSALADQIFTATEIRVECRRSAQAPEPRYRAGLVVYLMAARQGLWDPKFKNPFSPGQLKRLDAAWRAALAAAGDEMGEKIPDLEKDGAEGEYEKLYENEDGNAANAGAPDV